MWDAGYKDYGVEIEAEQYLRRQQQGR